MKIEDLVQELEEKKNKLEQELEEIKAKGMHFGQKRGKIVHPRPPDGEAALPRASPQLGGPQPHQPTVKPTRPAVLPPLLKPVATPALRATLSETMAPSCSDPAFAPP